MNEQQAREILKHSIRPDNSLYNCGHYTSWNKGDETICLDDNFDVEELRAIVWWMEHFSIKGESK